MKLKPGSAFNPFTKWPRNLSCYCGSGIKFKKCHEKIMVPYCYQHEAIKLKPDFDRTLEYVQDLHDNGMIYKLDKPVL